MSTISVEAAKKAFAEYDVDGDGQISLEGLIYLRNFLADFFVM